MSTFTVQTIITDQTIITEYIREVFSLTSVETYLSGDSQSSRSPWDCSNKGACVKSGCERLQYLKAWFPRQENNSLLILQLALLKVCGPLTCLWSKGIKLLDDEDAVISIRNVLEVIQHSLVTQTQQIRTKILQFIDQSLRISREFLDLWSI